MRDHRYKQARAYAIDLGMYDPLCYDSELEYHCDIISSKGKKALQTYLNNRFSKKNYKEYVACIHAIVREEK